MFSKKINFFIIGSVFLASILYAAVPNTGEAGPSFDYSQNFMNESERNSTTDFVGDDSAPKTGISQGLLYESNIGTATYEKVILPDGSTAYKNTSTGEITQTVTQQPTSSDYKAKLQAYYDANETEKATLQEEAILEAQKENKTRNMSVGQYESIFLKKLNPSGSASGVVNQYFLSEKESMTENEKNATKFYQQNFGATQYQADKKRLNESNVGKIKKAYDMVDSFKAELNAKYSGKNINCYISRQLIPAFYCPFPDMTNTLYPTLVSGVNQLKTASQEAKKTCENVCKKERSCVESKVVDSVHVDPNLGVKNIFPSYTEADSVMAIDFTDKAMLKKISIKIDTNMSDSFDGNQSTFEEFLSSNPVKFRISIIDKDTNASIPPSSIIDKQIVDIKSSSIEKSFFIGKSTKRLVIKLYKPYSYERIEDKSKEAKIFANIKSINISNIKGEYESENTFFCPFRQFVDNDNECAGKVIDVHNGSQVYHVCTDVKHKIGPDKYYGAFFSENSCTSACIESEECLPTYKQYTDPMAAVMFKAEIDCVDDPDNTACTKEMCQALFTEDLNRPLNEIVIYNDDNRVYTVRDKILTGTPRPRIDLGRELAAVDNKQDYQEMFQAEMKDAAYKYMINNSTFNRIGYTIGTPSPMRQAYKKEFISGQTHFSVLLKPNSFDVDSGKTFYLYSVIVFEQSYKPAFGVFMVDGQMIDAQNQNIMFKDLTYLIKHDDGTWKTFKKKEMNQVRKEIHKYECTTDGTTWTEIPKASFDSTNTNCRDRLIVDWIYTPGLLIDRDVMYDPVTDTFANYDPNMMAPAYLTTQFTSAVDYNTYLLTDYFEREIEDTGGATIHSQEEKDNGLSFRKVYNGNFVAEQRGFPANYWVYNYYSDTKLSYNEIINKINEGKGAIYELANPKLYTNIIRHDGEIGNDIKPFIFGTPDKTTISTDMKPSFSEEDQRVFKFLFLYDDNVADPFEGYQIQQ